MARSFIPDPLELLRQALNRLEGGANSLAGRGLEIDQVVKTLHQMSSLSMTLRQVVEMALDGFYKRLNLPSGREFAEMMATLQRLEDKLDGLLAAQATPRAPAPKRTRQPAPPAPAAAAGHAARPSKPSKPVKPAKAAAKRRSAAPVRSAR